MVIVKILRRKDGASVVVAIVLGLIILTLVSSVTAELSARISGTFSNTGGALGGSSWKVMYLQPVVSAVLQVLALEVLGWIYISGKDLMKNK